MTEESTAAPAARGGIGRALRLWLGIGITVVAIYWTFRDVDPDLVMDSVRSASWTPIVLIAAAQVFGLWIRALRWRHLAGGLADRPLPITPFFRATAVGFMAINVIPFRLGELVRPWFLATETPIRGSAALGTLILERAIDFACVALISGIVFYMHTAGFPAWFRTGALVFAALSLVPIALVVALRISEERTLAVLSAFVRPLPQNVSGRALDIVTQVCRGLAALSGPRPFIMVAAYSALMWAVIFPSVFLFGFWAFGVELPLRETVLAIYTLHVFTALAVAAPSAPGFFGVYHFACKEALGLFGVSSALAVAFGTVVHLAYWIPVTGVGAAIAIRAGTRFADLTSANVGKAPSEPAR